MPRILLAGDSVLSASLGEAFGRNGFEFIAVASGRPAVRVAREIQPHVALIDLQLPDISGFDVLAQLREYAAATKCIVVVQVATFDVAVTAMRLGACDCLQKPGINGDDVVTAVEQLINRSDCRFKPTSAAPEDSSEPSALTRWASLVMRVLKLPKDTPTLREFAHAVGVSGGAFRNCCRTAHQEPRQSVLFARALRAVYVYERDRSVEPEHLLSIVDCRTITKFVAASGGCAGRLPRSVEALLRNQQFITDAHAIAVVGRALHHTFAVPESTALALRNVPALSSTSL